MKCDNCPSAWESGGMTSCGYECDSYGCIIMGQYYGGEGEGCYLTKAQVKQRLQEWEDYLSGKIDRPRWVVNKFIRELDSQMSTVECGLPSYPPKRLYNGCHKSLYGSTDVHYERKSAYRQGYEDAKGGKPANEEYWKTESEVSEWATL